MTTGESITGFDFFEAGELPVPLVSTELAERWAQEAFGLVVRAVDLGSQQDANFLLVDFAGTSDVAEGTPVAVMKISNSAFDTDTVEDQDHAAQWVADSAAALRTPTRVGELAVLEASSGSHIVSARSTSPPTARAFTRVPFRGSAASRSSRGSRYLLRSASLATVRI